MGLIESILTQKLFGEGTVTTTTEKKACSTVRTVCQQDELSTATERAIGCLSCLCSNVKEDNNPAHTQATHTHLLSIRTSSLGYMLWNRMPERCFETHMSNPA